MFKRPIPFLNHQDGPSSVIGIKLESDEVWIIRIAAISGKLRCDIKAGSTKADILRVPNGGRGTWSDLLPVDSREWNNNSTLFLIEFI